MASRGAFAARASAPVKCVASMRSAVASRAILPVAPRMGQTSSFLGGGCKPSSSICGRGREAQSATELSSNLSST